MLLVVCLVDPREGVHEHVVEGGSDVAHERHEEEWHLQDRVLNEVDAFNYILVPCRLREIREEAEERDEDTNANRLHEMSDFELPSILHSETYRYSHKDSDHYAGQHRQCCLLVMLAGEQSGIFESSQGAHDGELSAPEDGIGLEVAHLAIRMWMCVSINLKERRGESSICPFAGFHLFQYDVNADDSLVDWPPQVPVDHLSEV